MGRKSEPENELQPLNGQRQSDESDSAVVACNDYLRLGSGRSLSRLADNYRDLQNFTGETPPTLSANTLMAWSAKFKWQARAAAYDATWEERKTQERNAFIQEGIALDFERVRKLERLLRFLEAQLYERGDDGVYHNIWLPDVKAIGTGSQAERVDIERFNAPLLEQYRKTLEDIAKEVGGRIIHTDHTTGGDKFIFPSVFLPQPIDDDDSTS